MNRIVLAAVMLTFTCAAQAAPSTEECSKATDLAATTFEARKQGLTEDQAMDMLRKEKIYSGLPVWAVKQALRAPIDTPEWLLRGSIMGECRKRE